MKIKFSTILVFSLCFCCYNVSAELRTWTDNQGRKIEAEYISSTDSHVKVRMANMRYFDIELSRLSDADIAYIEEQEESEDEAIGVSSSGPKNNEIIGSQVNSNRFPTPTVRKRLKMTLEELESVFGALKKRQEVKGRVKQVYYHFGEYGIWKNVRVLTDTSKKHLQIKAILMDYKHRTTYSMNKKALFDWFNVEIKELSRFSGSDQVRFETDNSVIQSGSFRVAEDEVIGKELSSDAMLIGHFFISFYGSRDGW